ncbi:unnamed protein product [Protopolystoma xenopodis]|uniref:Fibronectin type-III domain-containing protein n=1 Tax=Protopolystoma xenopodis TaxID=117903 RepID=A0A448XJH9_9PLAT|nr:unnamed protein product [Protopolystoma xenopodis]
MSSSLLSTFHRVVLSGLSPSTRYRFEVYAQNGVSKIADALWLRSASLVVTTRTGE